MSPLVLVAVFAACVPDAKQIGENEWVIILDEPPDFMRAGPSGHVALVADTEIAVVRPDGARAGRVTLSGRVVTSCWTRRAG